MKKLFIILTLTLGLALGASATILQAQPQKAVVESAIDNIGSPDSIATIAAPDTQNADSKVATVTPADTVKKKHLLQPLYDMADEINYFYVVVLMTVESSFVPFPSEIVVPPAGYMAAEGNMNIFLVILFATIGSLLGAFINYFLSLYLGRKIVYKFANSKLGHLMLLSDKKIQKAEDYFDKHGAVATLIGRLVPAVRQLISIPAGLAKMNILKFTLYTGIGAALWNTVLALLGYYLHSIVGSKEAMQAKLSEYETPIVIGICAVVGLGIIYVIVKAMIENKASKKD